MERTYFLKKIENFIFSSGQVINKKLSRNCLLEAGIFVFHNMDSFLNVFVLLSIPSFDLFALIDCTCAF